jgi:dienelactone hydrolase
MVRAELPKADSEVPITQWQLVGPFPFDKADFDRPDAQRLPVGLNRDYLKDLGHDEVSTDAMMFAADLSPKAGIALHPKFSNGPISSRLGTNILELAGIRAPFDYAVAYAAAVIESPQDRDIVIAVGADDNMKLYLNHELLAADPNTAFHGLMKFRRLIGAKLKKGDNFLLVKIGNFTGDWRLIVTLFPHERALQLARENAVNPVLDSNLFAVGEKIELRRDLLPSGQHAQAEVLDARHKPADSVKLDPDRLYFYRVSVGKEAIEVPFYYGDPNTGFQSLSGRAKQFDEAPESVRIDLQAQLARLKHLIQPESRISEHWDQKVAASFAEIEDSLAELEQSVDAFRHAAGTHIRGYRSAIDGQIQHYWLHVPEKALRDGKPLPIVIAMPYITGTHLPFLESYFLAAFDETEQYRILGDEYGFAVLQAWGRGNNLGGTALGTADIFEALETARKDYPIDSNRIYLLGYCEAGRLALLLAERYPNRFAAVSVEGPITIMHHAPSSADAWFHYASPVTAIGNLVNTPVMIRHDEADSPPIQESVAFASRAKAAGVNATLERVQGGIHGFYQNPMEEKRSMFEFFRGKQLPSTPRKVAAENARFRLGRGPIEDAFGSPILVVEGTRGTQAQHAVIHDLVEEFRSEWRQAYFVDCPVKSDAEVTAADIDKYNLIVVGDKGTNSVIERMGAGLPLRAFADHVSYGAKTFQGDHLGYLFTSPNPLNPQRYSVVIGMNQWAAAKEWRLNLSRDGICDYFIFDLKDSVPKLRDAGYFNEDVWRNVSRASAEPDIGMKQR